MPDVSNEKRVWNKKRLEAFKFWTDRNNPRVFVIPDFPAFLAGVAPLGVPSELSYTTYQYRIDHSDNGRHYRITCNGQTIETGTW